MNLARIPFALWLYASCLASLAGCTSQSQQTALTAASATISATTTEVDHQREIVETEIRADYRARFSACNGLARCLDDAKVATKLALRERIDLVTQAIAAQMRAAGAVDAAGRCATGDEACVIRETTLAAAASAEVATLLAKLRATAPAEVSR